jgi:hypothetical protein
VQGGVSTGYKKLATEKNLNDETYTSDSTALIQVSGTSVYNNKAVQVDTVRLELFYHYYSCDMIITEMNLFE